MKKIIIVEDNEDMQLMYKLIFRKHKDIQIVLQTDTAEQALTAVPELKPDLVIVDISLPVMDGIELTRVLKIKNPDIKILIVTAHNREVYENVCMEAGADDFITKGDSPEMIKKTRSLLNLT